MTLRIYGNDSEDLHDSFPDMKNVGEEFPKATSLYAATSGFLFCVERAYNTSRSVLLRLCCHASTPESRAVCLFAYVTRSKIEKERDKKV